MIGWALIRSVVMRIEQITTEASHIPSMALWLRYETYNHECTYP